jgi:hypothetical protein
MKIYLIAILLVSTPSWADYKCNRKVDKSKVVVFVDTRNSVLEVADAQKAACERGESFKRLPSDNSQIDAKKLTSELQKFSAGNIAVSSMVVSGHDGGGSIHGDLGSVDKYDVINALKTAYKTKPDLLNEFKSVFMWGCWTMGPSEVDVWRRELPSLKMASGFIDMGPLNVTKASHAILYDLLVKEKAIESEADQKKLKRLIAGVSEINQTYAAVYTESTCGDMYYYNTMGAGGGIDLRDEDDKNFSSGNHFVDFNKNFDCKSAADEIEKNRKELMPYFNGTIPLPKDGPNSPLMKIYAFIRSHAKCIKQNHVMNGDRILMMRFYDSVKANFANTFADISKAALDEFKSLDQFTKTYKAKGTPMQEFEKYFQGGKSKFFPTDGDTLKTKGRKEIIDMIAYLDGMSKLPMARDAKFSTNLKSLKRLKNAMETYLYQLNPSCMDFLEWHEYTPGYKTEAYCKV